MARVLIVDDDEFIGQLIQLKVTQLGYEVVRARDGEEGLRAAEAARPDVILLDLMMPRMNGLEMCRKLRAEEWGKEIPVVMLTARAQDRDIERGFAVGATDYLVKPFSPRELQARLRAMMERTAHLAPAAQ